MLAWESYQDDEHKHDGHHNSQEDDQAAPAQWTVAGRLLAFVLCRFIRFVLCRVIRIVISRGRHLCGLAGFALVSVKQWLGEGWSKLRTI